MHSTRHALIVGPVLGLLACVAEPMGEGDLPAEVVAKTSPAVLADLEAGQPVSLLVVVEGDARALALGTQDGAGAPGGPAAWLLAKSDLGARVADAGLVVDDNWDELPVVPITVDSLGALQLLLEDARVVGASRVEWLSALDAESFPLMGQPAALAAGAAGAGTSVAVLDTGVDFTHAAFGSCTAPSVPAGCKVAVARDFAVEDGQRDAGLHGSNVAGIVVGVAPATKVLALDVFDGAHASTATILAAYNWVLANRATYKVAAINLSLGGGLSATPCATDAMAAAFATARDAGIVTTVASGNGAQLSGISFPACAPAAVSVGAVYDASVGGLDFGVCADRTTAADRVACFSNTASFLTLLAPGALIDAAGTRMAGTSQAAPHVAGAVAALRSARPAESANQLVSRLLTTGRKITDARTGRTTPRIDLGAALSSTPPDGIAPTGTVIINGGASYTTGLPVTLTFAATDAVGVTEMCLGDPCTIWVTYAARATATLPAGANGTRTFTVRFRDRAGNVSAPASDTIVLDTVPPGVGLSVLASLRQVALRWTTSDPTAGVASVRLVAARGTSAPPALCTSGTVLASGTATSFTHAALASGDVWSYRLCATDRAGNVSPGGVLTVSVP